MIVDVGLVDRPSNAIKGTFKAAAICIADESIVINRFR